MANINKQKTQNDNFTRKIAIEDLIDKYNKINEQTNTNNHIPKNQKEFGHKKRIKPWRTGAKSQQQIAPKGFKKGFRG